MSDKRSIIEKLTDSPTSANRRGFIDASQIEGLEAQVRELVGSILSQRRVVTSNSAGRITNGVVTSDYVIITDEAKGLVQVSKNGHYWVLNIDNAGVPTWADIGTSAP